MADLSKLTIEVEWCVVLETDTIILVEFTASWGSWLVGYFDEGGGDDDRDDGPDDPDFEGPLIDTPNCRCSIAPVGGH